MSFIAGYIASLTVEGQSVEPYSSDATLSLTNETLNKTTLGVSNRTYITGLQDGTVDISMHVDTASMPILQASYGSTLPVAFVFRPGALGVNDAGQWNGDMIITSMDVSGAVEDNWAVSISGQITGAVTYTAPV